MYRKESDNYRSLSLTCADHLDFADFRPFSIISSDLVLHEEHSTSSPEREVLRLWLRRN